MEWGASLPRELVGGTGARRAAWPLRHLSSQSSQRDLVLLGGCAHFTDAHLLGRRDRPNTGAPFPFGSQVPPPPACLWNRPVHERSAGWRSAEPPWHRLCCRRISAQLAVGAFQVATMLVMPQTWSRPGKYHHQAPKEENCHGGGVRSSRQQGFSREGSQAPGGLARPAWQNQPPPLSRPGTAECARPPPPSHAQRRPGKGLCLRRKAPPPQVAAFWVRVPGGRGEGGLVRTQSKTAEKILRKHLTERKIPAIRGRSEGSSPKVLPSWQVSKYPQLFAGCKINTSEMPVCLQKAQRSPPSQAIRGLPEGAGGLRLWAQSPPPLWGTGTLTDANKR